MARETLAFDADVSEGSAVAGFLTQLSLGMQTDRHLAPVVEAAHATMASDFLLEFGAAAAAAEENFHHVYEWGHVGDPKYRLWKDVLRGRGANRTATFEWRPSVTTVPVPEIEPGPNGQKLQQIHTFVWKAPVMEYDIRVNIRPKAASALAFPTGDADKPLWFSKVGITFRPGRFQMANGESRLRGGTAGHTAGQFTKAYIGWWGGLPGEVSFNRGIRKTIENNFGQLPIEQVAMKFRRSKAKTFRLNVGADAQKAFAYGERKAQTWLIDRDRDYYAIAAARKRRDVK
jgi:hypothetical protein